jgi:hypothetical protein
MINLQLALEHDHEYRGEGIVKEVDLEYPFEEIETAALAAEDGFEFQVSRVVTAMESHRPFSRRHRAVETAAASVALEEVSDGFWALLALAVAAAIALIGKMLGWFDGGGSGGGGGGGGGGSPIEKVEKKVEAVKATIAQSADTVEETINNPSVEIRDVENSAEVKEVVEAQIKGLTEFQFQCCMEKSEFGKLMEEAMDHLGMVHQNSGTVAEAVGSLVGAWETIDAGEAEGKFISKEGFEEIGKLSVVIGGLKGTKAVVNSYTLKQFIERFYAETDGWKNSHRTFSKSDLRTHHKNIARIYSNEGTIEPLFAMIGDMSEGLEAAKSADKMLREKVQPFIDREASKSPHADLTDKSDAGKAAGAKSLLGIGKAPDSAYLAARHNAETATRTAYKEYLAWMTSFLRLNALIISNFNEMATVLQQGVVHTHAVLRASAAALKKDGKEVSEALKKAIDNTKPGRK